MSIRLLIIQYAGDYREAVNRFALGGDETYYAQKYSVETVAEMAKSFDEVAVLCCLSTEPYDELLVNGVRAIGAGLFGKKNLKNLMKKDLIKLIEKYNPTHLVIMTPIRSVIRWAIQKKVKTLLTLADSFDAKTLINKIKNYQLVRLLNNKQIDWIGNHGTNSSFSLAKMGVKTNKIIPWDWPHNSTPALFSPKKPPEKEAIWQYIYVGAIIETKGVGDILRAISILKSKGYSTALKIVGKGDIETYKNLAKSLKIDDCVEFLGLLPNKEIIPAMRRADTVLIPSRYEYPEGFPMTIYEALCSRTPIIASDHPMFSGKLIDENNALVFTAGQSESLANCMEKLISSPQIYINLSMSSYDAWNTLQIPVKKGDLINAWLSNSPESQKWLSENTLASGRYDKFRVT